MLTQLIIQQENSYWWLNNKAYIWTSSAKLSSINMLVLHILANVNCELHIKSCGCLWELILLNYGKVLLMGFYIYIYIWRSPDTSKVRSKMLYASSKDRFKRELDGIQVELQATDPSEMSMDIIKSRAIWGMRNDELFLFFSLFFLCFKMRDYFHFI